jgi:RNA polymerase sigma-70 factor, ECF subfamily
MQPLARSLHAELSSRQSRESSAAVEPAFSGWPWASRVQTDSADASRPARAALVDAAIIEACQRGDADAFRQVFDAYKTRVYSMALHFTGDHGAANDVSQQVFITVYNAISRFRRESAFDTWLYRIVVNACWHEHRRRRRFVSLDEVVEPPQPREASVERDYLRQERIQAVREGIASLKPKLRLPLVLRHLEGWTYEEIAAILGVSSGTVASRLNRARARLARQLAHLQADV